MSREHKAHVVDDDASLKVHLVVLLHGLHDLPSDMSAIGYVASINGWAC